jgi:hypothetical protein
VVVDFNAELYLRLIGEEALLDAGRDRGGWSSPLDEAAGALVAVGAISAASARRVAADYSLAQSLRIRDGFHPLATRARRSPRRKPTALRFRRVVPLTAVIEYAQGRLELRYALFDAQETALAFVYRTTPEHRGTRGRRGSWMMMGGAGQMPWGAASATLTDDCGNSAALSFTGGGSELEWIGRLRTQDPISADTRWLELDGHRLELDAAPPAVEVSIEALQEVDPAHRYLWQLLGFNDRHSQTDALDPALDALIAAGALTPDDPVIDELQAVRERLTRHPRHNPGTRGARKLPEPWRSLLRRVGKADGPSGLIVLGAVTPVFDGHCIGILSIESGDAGFQAEVEVTGGAMHHPRFGAGADQRLAWWARDDRGNNYLGAFGRWSGGENRGGGEIEFWPALDPHARRLEVCPTATNLRAVIGFDLRWAPPSPATATNA